MSVKNVFAEVDAWKARVVEENREAQAVRGWRAIVDMPVPTMAPRREWEKNKLPPMHWRRLEVRFRVHDQDPRVWVMRPCGNVADKWRGLGKYDLAALGDALLTIFGWRRKQQLTPSGIDYGWEWPPGVSEQARRLVRALVVERDTWLESGGAVRHTMRQFDWNDFAVNAPAAGASKTP